MNKFAGIIINNEAVQVDRIFTYIVPERLQHEIALGYRVKVPFGKANRKVDGFVIRLYDDNEEFKNLKEIFEICDEFKVLRNNDIKLIEWMRERYFCTYLQCIKTIIPTGMIRGVKKKRNVVFI